MIIRLHEKLDPMFVKERTTDTDGLEYGRINLLMFTSAELRENFGISLSETDFATAFELARALTHHGDRELGLPIRKSNVARAVANRPGLLPSFVAYQEMPGGRLLPLMTDGHESNWSLLFDEEGEMTLVEYRAGTWKVTAQAELLPPVPEKASPLVETKGFLLNGIRSAKKMLVRPDGKS